MAKGNPFIPWTMLETACSPFRFPAQTPRSSGIGSISTCRMAPAPISERPTGRREAKGSCTITPTLHPSKSPFTSIARRGQPGMSGAWSTRSSPIGIAAMQTGANARSKRSRSRDADLASASSGTGTRRRYMIEPPTARFAPGTSTAAPSRESAWTFRA